MKEGVDAVRLRIRRLALVAAAGAALAAVSGAAAAPANDSFSSAQTISGWNGTVTGSNVGATFESKEPVPSSFSDRKTIWYRWTAPQSGNAVFDTLGSAGDTILSVYTGSRVSRLTLVTRNDDSAFEPNVFMFTSRVEFPAKAGVAYSIQIDTDYGAGAITLTWNRRPPANDAFAAAQAISGGTGTVRGTNLLATSEANEPVHAGVGQGKSVWYRWTAPATGQYRFNLKEFGEPSMGAVLAVYSGSQLGSLKLVGAAGYCNSYAYAKCVLFEASAGAVLQLALDGSGYSRNQGEFEIAWETVPYPPNDSFANAATISGLSGTVSGTTYGATAEPGEPDHGWRAAKNSIWYRFTPPFDGQYRFDVSGSQYTTRVAVYEGASLTTLTPPSTDQLKTGTTYFVALDSDYAAGTTTLAWRKLPPPNDARYYASWLDAEGTLTQNNAAATKEAGEPSHAGDAGGASVWFEFTNLVPGALTLDTSGSAFATVMAVYPGTSNVSVATRSGNGALTIRTDGGVTYAVAVDGVAGAIGTLKLTWRFAPLAPPNDDFADAVVIAGEQGHVFGRSDGATRESGEPDHAGASLGKSVWYRWIAPASGRVVFDTFDAEPCSYYSWCFSDMDYDGVLAVYEGTSLGTLTPAGANDDHYWSRSRVAFPVTRGAIYYVAVDTSVKAHREYAQGRLVLNWNIAPLNDDLASAEVMNGASGTFYGTSLHSTYEAWDGDPSERYGPGSVWYRWRAVSSGWVTVTPRATDWVPEVDVYVGPSYEVLRVLDLRYDRTTKQYSFEAFAGEVYRIRVSGDYWGDFTLAWEPGRPPAIPARPPNDDLAAAQALAGESGSVAGTNSGATYEPWEPPDEYAYPHLPVWYRWTAPSSGTYVWQATPGSVAVFEGAKVVRVNYDRTGAARIGATAGTTYSIAVGAYDAWSASGTFTLAWQRLATAPANDGFAAATTLAGASGTVDATNADASPEAGEPRHADIVPRSSVWYRWTASASGRVSFQTAKATGIDTRIGVYTGSAVGSLTRLAGNEDAAGGTYDSRVTFAAEAGRTYAIAVDTMWERGAFTLSWRQPPSPPNDAFANAAPMPYSAYWNRFRVNDADNFGATRETGEPVHGGVAGGASVWFRLDYGSYSGDKIRVDTIGSDLDTVLAVYTGTSVGSLTLIASDDDSAGAGRSSLTFTTEADQYARDKTYWIAVDGKNGANGEIVLNVAPTYDAPNDNFAQAMPISGLSGTVRQHVVNATWEYGEPDEARFGMSVWYRWTAPVTGTQHFDVVGTSVAADVGVYVGDRLTNLVNVATSYERRSLNVPVVAGQVYYVLVSFGYDPELVLNWRPANAPAHDNLAAALTLTGDAGSVSYSNEESSYELSEPLHAGEIGLTSHWYRWTAPSTGTLSLDTRGSEIDTLLGVYTGGSMASLADVDFSDDAAGAKSSGVRLRVAAGTTYLIAVDAYTGTYDHWWAPLPVGTMKLSWSFAPPPANDLFASAQALSGTSGSTGGTTVGADVEADEPWHAEREGEASVWYRWTAPADGTWAIDVAGTGFSPVVGAYQGSTLAGLAVVRRSDDTGGRATRLLLAATAGKTYAVAVAEEGWDTGAFTLSWAPAAPGNDAFAAAQTLTGRSGHVAASSRGATKEAGEPAHAGDAGGASLWFGWTAPETELVAFDTVGSDFDTLLAVYTGGSVGGLAAVAASNDAPGVSTSSLRFHAVAGTTYRIAVDGVAGSSGNVLLNWKPAPHPDNDDLAAAAVVEGREGLVAGTTLAGTTEAGEPAHSGALAHSVWYRWKAPVDGTAHVWIEWANFDTTVAVYRGDTYDALVRVADGLSRLSFPVVKDAVYSIAVDGGAGGFDLAWRLPAANDDFASAQVLVGASGTVAGTTEGAAAEPGEPAHGGYPSPYQTVWYAFTPSTSGTYVLETTPATRIVVYTGDTLSSLARVAGGRFGAAAGTTYRFVVEATATPFSLSWRLDTTAPPNDNFAAAHALSGTSGAASASTAGASREAGEPDALAERTIWYRWTAPSSGRASFHTRGSLAQTRLLAYRGSSLGALTQLAWAANGTDTEVQFDVAAGAVYHVAVDGVSEAPVKLSWELDASIPAAGWNDLFANAVVLGGEDGSINGTTGGATAEAGEPAHYYSPARQSVWYRWTAPASRTYSFRPTDPSRIAVYTGSAVNALTLVTANSYYSGVVFTATAGTVYRIAVDEYYGTSGPFTLLWQPGSASVDTWIEQRPPPLTTSTSATFTFRNSYGGTTTFRCSLDGSAFTTCLSPTTYNGLSVGTHVFRVAATGESTPAAIEWRIVPLPANDNLAAATLLAGETGTAEGWTAGATRESGEPQHNGVADGRSIWYRWTAPRDGILRLLLTSSGYEASIAVYTGSSYGGLTHVAADRNPYSTTAGVDFRVEAGVEYRIALDNYVAYETLTKLTWKLSPPNDAFADALPVTTAAVSAQSRHATYEWSEPPHGGLPAAHSVWFTWTAASDGTATVDTFGSDFDTRLAVYTGDALDSLALVAEDDDAAGGRQSAVVFRVLRGGVYRIAVDGYAGLTGTIRLNVAGPTAAPPETTIDSGPAGAVRSTSATFSFSSNEPGATFECALDWGAFGPCSSPKTYRGLDVGDHTFGVRAVDADGHRDPTPAERTWTALQPDTTTPDTIIDSYPASTTTSTTATFAFFANESDVTFECSLDGAPFGWCASPHTYTGLTSGTHVFRVRATDSSGNVDVSPASYSWTIGAADATPPETTILSGPPASTTQPQATFEFAATETAGFACSLDGAAYAACTSPASYGPLPAGAHVFRVRATDAAGNTDPTPAEYSWTIQAVDSTPPETIIASGPPTTTTDSTATLAFHAGPDETTFECSLDFAAFASCTSPMTYSGLALGDHTFQVRATDAAGNVDPSPAMHSWTVTAVTADTTPPDTRIDSTTASGAEATFAFSATEAGASFGCSLDGAGYAVCTSPVSYTALAAGDHVFRVRATDPAGNTDSSPAEHTWTIAASPPPSGGTGLANGSFESGLDGWGGWQSILAQVDGGADGSKAAKITSSTGSGWYSISTNPDPISNAAAGATYSAKAQIRSDQPGKTTCFGLREWTGGTIVGKTVACPSSSSTWQQVGPVTYTIQKAGSTLEVYAIADGGQSFHLDAVELTGGG